MISGLNWVLNLDSPLINLFNATYGRIEAKAQVTEHLHSLTNVFDEAEAQLWIDTWGHVTPAGNELVAQAIIEIIADD